MYNKRSGNEITFFIGDFFVVDKISASTDYDPSSPPFYSLDGSNTRSCQEIRTFDDDKTEATEQFSLSLSYFPVDGLVILQPSTITFVLTDNDGETHIGLYKALIVSYNLNSLYIVCNINMFFIHSTPFPTSWWCGIVVA